MSGLALFRNEIRSSPKFKFRSSSVDCNSDASAIGELAKKDLIRQRLLDLFVNQPRHRPCTVARIKSILRKPLSRRFVESYDHAFLGKLAIQLVDKFVDDQFDDLDVERLERHPRIQTISKLRRERPLDHTFRLALCFRLIAETDTAG